jgi:hypothetical protein
MDPDPSMIKQKCHIQTPAAVDHRRTECREKGNRNTAYEVKPVVHLPICYEEKFKTLNFI